MKNKKDKMWIACCGCFRAISLPETTTLILMESSSDSLIWKSECPHCGYKHKLTLTKW